AAAPAAGLPRPFVDAFRTLLRDETLEPAFRAQALALPGEAYLLERMTPADPAALRAALVSAMHALGDALAADWLSLLEAMRVAGGYRYHPGDAGRRALANLALRYLAAAGNADGLAHALSRFETATDMTVRFGALAALAQ